MSEKKVLGFSVEIDGISNENAELAKLELQLKGIKRERDALRLQASRGGFASREEITQLAAYNTEIKKQEDALKNLKRVVDTASDSLARKKALLIELKQQYDSVSGAMREKMAPQINKLTADISKAEIAIGTHSRGVGNYTGAIKNAALGLISFAAVAAIATKAINGIKEAFFSTDQGMGILRQWSEMAKTFFYGVIKEHGDFKDSMTTARDVAKELNNLRIEEREEIKKTSKLENEVKLLRLEAAKGGANAINLYKEADEKENERIQIKTDHLNKEIQALKILSSVRKEDSALLDLINAKEVELIQVTGEKNLRIQTKIATLEAKALKDKETANQKIIDGQNKLQGEVDKFNEDKAKKQHDWDVHANQEADKFIDQEIERMEKEKAAKDKQWIEADKAGDAFLEREVNRMEKEADAKVRIEQEMEIAKAEIMNGSANLLSAVAGKNKAIQKAALIADKAVAIAEIIIQTRKANVAIMAWGALAGPAGWAIALGTRIANNIAAGINIAAVVAAAAGGLAGFAKGGKINRGVTVNTGTKDDTLIVANKTETVLTQDHVRRLGGSGIMRRIGVPGYEMGGYLGTQSPEIPSQGLDITALARMMNAIEVRLDINKLNTAQNELNIVNQTQRI